MPAQRDVHESEWLHAEITNVTSDPMLEQGDIDESEWLLAAATNPAFDFLKEPEEDIYTLQDGKPYHAQG